MKKVIFLLCFSAIISCKQDSKKNEASTQNDELTQLVGDYIFYDNVGVLQTQQEVYAVVVDDKLKALEAQVAPLKKNPTDMVKVEVRGVVSPKPANEEGWPFRVAIKEIIKVTPIAATANEVIKIE